VTPPRFRSLGQPETRFADEKVVTQQHAQKDGPFWLVWLFRSGSIDRIRSSVNWPLAKVLQRYGDTETGLNPKTQILNPEP
jgi:hypothetical protein